ncbi:MAG TPA: antitoxin MazE family protein [Stellaceae bacterium]|nr:antitoxin MazE family protein [Stellaceae bacterium]
MPARSIERLRLAPKSGRAYVTCNIKRVQIWQHAPARDRRVTRSRHIVNECGCAGLRPIQIWVPDVGSADFVTEAHRQSIAVATSTHAREDQDFVDAVSDRGGDA